MSKKRWKADKNIILPGDRKNVRMQLTISEDMWLSLDLIRDPSISIQECIRQIVAAYIGVK